MTAREAAAAAVVGPGGVAPPEVLRGLGFVLDASRRPRYREVAASGALVRLAERPALPVVHDRWGVAA